MEKSSCPTASNAPLKSKVLFLLALLLFLFVATENLAAAQTAENSKAAVQAILFYSPTCPHCHQVINELLIPMQEEYGDQLQIIGIDTSNPTGEALYGRAIEHFEIPQNRLGVPTLIVNDTILVGSMEIPEQFPGIVEEGLAAGGIGWPEIPDLTLIIPDLPPSAQPAKPPAVSEPAAASSTDGPQDSETDSMPTADSAGDAVLQAESEEPLVAATPPPAAVQSLEDADREINSSAPTEEPPADPVGFTLAWVVLFGMIAAFVYALRQIFVSRPLYGRFAKRPYVTWLVPLLALLGLGIALYLAYVELTHVEAVCGPVGECNIVQSSSYAQLFGIPIAILGILSYLAIVVLWAGQRYLPARLASWCYLGLILLTVFGTLFSIYLTLIELFAIGAICAWCLTSAVITSVIMVLITKNLNRRSPQMKLAAQTKN